MSNRTSLTRELVPGTMAECGALVIGRAIVTSDNSNFTTWGQRVAQKTQNWRCDKEDLIFGQPNFSDKQYAMYSLIVKTFTLSLC